MTHTHECRVCGDGFPCHAEDTPAGCPEFDGLCPSCERREAEDAILATVEHRCWCEHEVHAPDYWCHNDAAAGAVADYVGNVCRQCADTHYAAYIIWPEALLDDRSIFTVTPPALRVLREQNPGVDFPTRVVRGSNDVYVPATFEQVARARAVFTD